MPEQYLLQTEITNTIKFCNMKYIQPLPIWNNGKIEEATILNVYVIHDNLNDSATFFYSLFSGSNDEPGNILATGNITMNPDDYLLWIDDTTLYAWISKTLNVTFI